MADIKITALPEITSPASNVLFECVSDPSGTPTSKKVSLGNIALSIGTAPGVKVYRATITQSGNNAPSVTVFENSLGGVLVWSYTGVGIYTGTLAGVFLAGKVYGCSGIIDPLNQSTFILARSSNNTVAIQAAEEGILTDDIMANIPMQILVYP